MFKMHLVLWVLLLLFFLFFLATVCCDHSFSSLLLYFFKLLQIFSSALSSFLWVSFITLLCYIFLVPALLLLCDILSIPLVCISLVRLSHVPFSFSSLCPLARFLRLMHVCFVFFSLCFECYRSVSIFLSLLLLTGTIYPLEWVKENKGRKTITRKLHLNPSIFLVFIIPFCVF